MNKKWIVGQRMSAMGKAVCLLLLLFVAGSSAILVRSSNGSGQWFGVLLMVVVFLPVLSWVLYRTWFFVDEKKQIVYIKKSLIFTWVQSLPYKWCCLDVGGNSVKPSDIKGYGNGGTQCIFLVNRGALKLLKRKE